MNIRNYFFIALAAAAGCGGDDNTGGNGSATTPTASGVFPSQAFQGKDVRIEVTGDATTWSAAATVSFGPGVTVNSVALASPTDLIADVTISGTAALGLSDVVVTDGSDTFTLTKAFEIDAPFTFATTGTLAQGSVLSFAVTSLDFGSQFDATSDGNGGFPDLNFTPPAGVTMFVNTADTFHVTGTMLVDVDAAGGALSLASGAAGATTTFALPDLAIAKRTATPLTSGTAVTGMITAPLQTDLYTFTTGTGPLLASIAATTTSTTATVGLIILPASGHFADLIKFGPSFSASETTSNDEFYAIYWDNSGESGYSYSLTATSTTLNTALEAEPNNVSTLAQQLTVPAQVTDSSLSTTTDVDFYKITIAAGDIGKHIHVITTDGGVQTDTVVDLFGPGATTAFGTSSDVDFGEDFDSDPITTAGTYFVKVSLSTFNGASAGAYVMTVLLD